ncbi:transposase [Chryseobacterium oranimense]|uniref:transposase n=1 Tax=Chryseobacterium oranimense TaxID=421058 RepID=UPI0021B054EA|nr:transposase [Chryseobacterium oranimense]UWX61537.1 transposase [Chryseobacterium oranimense]
MNFKDIHIGELIHRRFQEEAIGMRRACTFFECSEKEVKEMFIQKDVSANTLLKWSKLLEYDFFRVYSHHLVLYSPQRKRKGASKQGEASKKSALPQFKKSLYTIEIITFIIELISSGEKSKKEIIEEYNIPKTTLYKWLHKYK